jgi:hypothetical protein
MTAWVMLSSAILGQPCRAWVAMTITSQARTSASRTIEVDVGAGTASRLSKSTHDTSSARARTASRCPIVIALPDRGPVLLMRFREQRNREGSGI